MQEREPGKGNSLRRKHVIKKRENIKERRYETKKEEPPRPATQQTHQTVQETGEKNSEEILTYRFKEWTSTNSPEDDAAEKKSKPHKLPKMGNLNRLRPSSHIHARANTKQPPHQTKRGLINKVFHGSFLSSHDISPQGSPLNDTSSLPALATA